MARRWSVALLAIVFVGCVSLALETPPPVVTHPHLTGERDLLLRMDVGGGLPWPAKTIEEPPRFTLLGNGMAIHTVATQLPDGSIHRGLQRAQLTAEQVDALLADALGSGGLAVAQERYRDVDVYDATTTTFEIHAGGIDKTVHVYALGLFDVSAPSRLARIAFAALAERLNDFGVDVADGKATDVGAFDPEAYQITLDKHFSDAAATADWPWDDLAPTDFATGDDGNLARRISPAQAKSVLDLGIQHDLVATAPDGAIYLIRIRLLLPDEID